MPNASVMSSIIGYIGKEYKAWSRSERQTYTAKLRLSSGLRYKLTVPVSVFQQGICKSAANVLTLQL